MAEKRRRKVIWAGLAAALMLVCGILFASCGGGYTPSQSDSHVNGQSSDAAGDSQSSSEIEIIEVTSVSLNKTSLTLEVGESERLTATVLPDDATDKNVIWSSSSESVAAVNDGTVRALSSGTATIIATTSNGKAAVCSVTVTDPVVEVSSVTLNKSELTLEVDESETLTATVLPSNATDKSVTWTSSAPAVATVADGKVTAIGGGTATITAETSNGKTATCTVTINDPYADFSFTLSGSGYILAAYSGTDTEVTVPAEYKGKAVAVIGSRAFYDCSFITKIILPDSLKEIGDVAFGYCTSLQTVEIPACTRILNNVFLGCTGLREVTLPDGVVTIGSNLFTNCNSLQKVTILSGSVLRYTFADCANLKEIVIGENVTSVAQGAFEDCTSLQYLTLPRVDENTSFNEYYFNLKNQIYTLNGSGADDLYPAETRSYTVNIGGVNRVFALPVNGTDWYYSRSSTTVDGVTYQYSGKPITVTSWESMYEATVGVSWRRPKTWTAEVYIPQDSSLTKLTVTDQLISIYDEVFDGCGCEIDIVQKFPVESVSVIGETELYLDEFSLDDYILRVKHTDGWIEDLPLAEHLSETDKQELQQSGAHSLTVSYGGQSCEFNIVLNLHIFDTAVLDDMTFVADGSAKYLQVTGIPEDTEIIWENNGQTEVGEYTVTATLKKTYYEDKTLTAHLYIRQAQYNITYVLGVEEAENANPEAYTFGEGLTLSSPASGAWEFLGWYADADFTEKVTAISAQEYGDKTFYAQWRSIFEYANGEITGFTEYGQDQYDNGKLTSISIPAEIDGQKITSIGDSAFSGYSKLTSVTIGDGVTSIRYSAFSRCSGLTSVTIPDSVASIGNYAFRNCSKLTSVTIGNDVTSIGEYAFYDCSGLTSVTIGNGVTSIGDRAFEDCSSLTNVTLGNSVTSIGEYAFFGCSGLTSIEIPDSVTSIGSYAFSDCNNLTIYCEAASQPSGWNRYWNSGNCPVVWGFEWVGVDVTYNFVSNGGTEIESIVSATPIALPVPEKDRYIFGGWYLSSDFSGNTVSSPYYNAEGATLYAKWIDLGGLEQSVGLEIENGYIVGIGTCTDTELILNMPIAEGAFIGCHTITKVTFGPGVTSIGYQAFGNSGTGCNNLTEVVFLSAEPPKIGSDVFGSTWNHSAGFTVYVPQGSLEAYEAVEDRYWQQYLVDAGKIKEM